MRLAFIGCIFTRLGLAYYARSSIAPITGLIGVGFGLLYLTNSRMNAPESSTGVTYWHRWRWIHSAIYLTSTYLLVTNQVKLARGLLLADTIFGVFVYSKQQGYI